MNYDAFSGENVALEGAVNDAFDIDGPSVSRTRGTGANSQVYVVDTDDFETGDYNITNEAGTETVLEVSDLGLEVEVDEEEFETDEDVTATVTSDTINRPVTVDLLDSDGDVYDTVTGEIDSNGEFDADFGQVSDEDTYSIEVTDDDSGVTATSSDFDVVEAGEGGVQFANGSVDVTQGDVAEITVELDDVESGYVVIGDQDDANYQANISVTDGVDDADADGEVTILFNTYQAGQTSGTIVEAESDDDEATLEDQNSDAQELGTMLDTGDYEMISAAADNPEDAFSNEDDVSTLLIEERTAPEMTLWRTSPSGAESVSDALDDDDVDVVTAINDSVNNDAITETDSVALDPDGTDSDVLVHQVTAPGLEGALESVGASDNTATENLYELLNNGNNQNNAYAADLIFEEQNPGRNAEAKTINASELGQTAFENVFTVAYDGETGNYYILVDQDSLNDEAGEDFEDGDEFSAEFTVQDERLLQGSASGFDNADDLEDAYETANATFDVEEAEAEFDTNDDDLIEAPMGENSSVTGSTNVAPGTEFAVRLRSTDETSPRFTLTANEVSTGANGSFEAAPFDLSEQSVNDTFEATFRQAAFDGQDAVDGVIVESAGNGTDGNVTDGDDGNVTDGDDGDDGNVTDGEDGDDGNVTDGDDGTDDGTDDGEDGTDDGTDGTDGETEDGTPGFGALVALVALIAAALLATRRRE
ncbi:BGTF surface domain-containing protein [Halorubrum sp. CSM-61]|uniref:DUF7827 domain-containing protein n=1 Tax=Halorubrum sp. CSM-61 TaxID=2485838 RepID=UPI0013DDF3DD|nr:BGTF surface domain-containing protein [Halorubrum sp. CSM-61]